MNPPKENGAPGRAPIKVCWRASQNSSAEFIVSRQIPQLSGEVLRALLASGKRGLVALWAMAEPTTTPDALLEMILNHRPTAGEDFFAFSVVLDAQEPTWEERRTLIGDYETAARLCVACLGALGESRTLTKGRVELYQGDAARAYLFQSLIDEARYRQERESVPKN